jgi:methylated-DNA-[protein]-cysteine S-methyltransferase
MDNRQVELTVVSDGEAIIGTFFGDPPGSADHDHRRSGDRPEILRRAETELRAYAAGELTEFSVPLRPKGSEFQLEVWRALSAVPYGTTTTYGRIAGAVGRPTASRAIGGAVGANPIGIIIPCHRVIGVNGALTGFAGGLDNKITLLRREGITAL